jgi:hypothetical protein
MLGVEGYRLTEGGRDAESCIPEVVQLRQGNPLFDLAKFPPFVEHTRPNV